MACASVTLHELEEMTTRCCFGMDDYLDEALIEGERMDVLFCVYSQQDCRDYP